VPILISLGDQASHLENILWLGRGGRDRVHTCPSRHRHQEERSVLQCFFVTPRASCRSCAQRSHHAQLTGTTLRELWHPYVCESRSMRADVEVHGVYHPFACGWPAGCLPVETMHLQGQTFCCVRVLVRSMPAPLWVRAKAQRSQEALTRWASPSARSAQIKGAVRVHQESLIR